MIILAPVAYPIVWLLVVIAPAAAIGDAFLFVALSLQGLAAGIENSNEMGYCQALTPDGLLGRVNATRRSVNRTMAALGAPIAGLVVGLIGDRAVLSYLMRPDATKRAADTMTTQSGPGHGRPDRA